MEGELGVREVQVVQVPGQLVIDRSLDFAVKYPFSESAKQSIAGIDLSAHIVELATERIKKALKGESTARMLFHESDKKEDIASFAAARMILGHLRNNFLTNRFAVNESKIVRASIDHEPPSVVDLVAVQFGITTSIDHSENNRMVIPLPTYLKYSTHAPHYKLTNRRLSNGLVEITPSEKHRLIEEAVRKHIEHIPLVKDPPDLLKEAGKKLIAELPKTEAKLLVVKGNDHPPCIARLFEAISKHENLPHHARWFLASYLLAIGTSEENIVKLFSGVPDFSEKVTAYQVSHIKKKGYSVPSCATVMTYGLCCAVCKIGSPLGWHNLDDGRKKLLKPSTNQGQQEPTRQEPDEEPPKESK